ncbi:uncharacterized protein TNCT_198051 [Trichonephila clavata]|uniref:Uncharacterized protein n=1 Tax=Trichonephila clavata TaxID=2740835 RepID=A0A8X6LM82_TRICU|nr:uncharacterized protein TNCT_198051 [Trichonephila clavata]
MELKQLLQRGGMTLHKWCTNLSPTNAKEFPLDRNSEEIQVKTLGMIWNSATKLRSSNSLDLDQHYRVAVSKLSIPEDASRKDTDACYVSVFLLYGVKV